jgi:hypothetical protein
MKARQFIDEMAEFLYPGEEVIKDHFYASTGIYIVSTRKGYEKYVHLESASIDELKNRPVVLVGQGSFRTSTGVTKLAKVEEPAPPWLVTMVRDIARPTRSGAAPVHTTRRVNMVRFHPRVVALLNQFNDKVKARQAQWGEKYKAKHQITQGKPVETIADFSKVKGLTPDVTIYSDDLSVIDRWEQTIDELDVTGLRYFIRDYESDVAKGLSFMNSHGQPGDQVYRLKGPREIFILVSPGERAEFDRFMINLHRRVASLAIGD